MAKNESEAYAALSQLKRRDLQKACIRRGMEFMRVREATTVELHDFYTRTMHVEEKEELLDQFDRWWEKELVERGYTEEKDPWAFHPMMRMGFKGKIDPETGEPIEKPKKEKPIKEKKLKKRKNKELGITAGTKKEYTFILAKKGRNLDYVTELVKTKFPEAQEKSIRIWYNKAIKQFGITPEASTPKPKQEVLKIIIIQQGL